MNEELVRVISQQLIETAGDVIISRIGRDNIEMIAVKIAEYRIRVDSETNLEKKVELEKDISFLESSLLLKTEIKKLKLSAKARAALKAAIQVALKTQFPFLMFI